MTTRKVTEWRPRLEALEERRLLSIYADFNGDGFEDLAIGVHGENNLTGAVSIVYGSLSGLESGGKFATPDQLWSQDSADMADSAEAGDQFGRALAAGDFNNDGYADLAIGVPFEDGTVPDIGMVQVLHGTAAGLTATGSQVWQQGLLGQDNEAGDRFGASLAVGDLNNDGFADLVVGRPGESSGSTTSHGQADVIYGSVSGLTALGYLEVDCDLGGVIDKNDQYGASLAVGDFNNDGFDDLAIGVPGHDKGSGNDEMGAVQVLYFDFDGYACDSSAYIDQDTNGIPGELEDFDRFGFSLAAGDFNGDGVADLAIGVPFEDVGVLADAGAAHVLYGANGTGLTTFTSQLWTQDALVDLPEAIDYFGVALLASDFNGDGFDELAIGVPREDIGTAIDAGAVHIVFGSPSGLTATGNLLYSQDTASIEDAAESNDQFGYALAANDYNGDGRPDLAVGVIQENGSGAVHVLYGSATGFSTTTDELWTQNSFGIEDSSEVNDFFGIAFPGVSGVGNAGFSGQWLEVVWTTNGNGKKGKLTGTVAVTNPGFEVAAASIVRFYLSDDPRFSDTDQLLDEANLDVLLAGETVNVDFKAKLGKGQTAVGKYVLAVLDADNAVTELREDNNVIVFGPIADRWSPGGERILERMALLSNAVDDANVAKRSRDYRDVTRPSATGHRSKR